MTPLLLAPVEVHQAIGGALLDSGTNAEDEAGCWPSLHSAAEKGLKAIVGALLVVGADPEAKEQWVRRWWVQGESVPVRCGSYWVVFISYGTEGSFILIYSPNVAPTI